MAAKRLPKAGHRRTAFLHRKARPYAAVERAPRGEDRCFDLRRRNAGDGIDRRFVRRILDCELGTLALLDYIEENPDGFRIISRDSSPYSQGGTFQTILSSIASRVEGLLAAQFQRRGFDPGTAPLYSQMLVGLVALAGQWWVESREETTLTKPQVAAHLVNLTWHGMQRLHPQPSLRVVEAPPEAGGFEI